jgi:hypothetical protein
MSAWSVPSSGRPDVGGDQGRWESGMDNSPMWDSLMERMWLGPEQIPEYRRADLRCALSRAAGSAVFTSRAARAVRHAT